jgi:hypothetical protein
MNQARFLVASLDMQPNARTSPRPVSVSERNLQAAASRLFPNNVKLVSTEVEYLRRVLGDKALQSEIDEKVLLVRKLSWKEISGDAEA